MVIIPFTVLALLAGWTCASALHLNRPDRAVVAVEFATRNVGIAALLAMTTLQQPEFAAFGALFLLFQAPVLLLALLVDSRRLPGPAHPKQAH
jgi:predicted Na+-dependent transporter